MLKSRLKWLSKVRQKRLSEKQIRFSNMFAVFLTWAIANGYQFSIGEVFRPGGLKFVCPKCKKEFEFLLQDVYIYMGRSKVRHSKHQDKLAVDIFLLEKGDFITSPIITLPSSYKPLGDFWKSLDLKNRWGGDFKGLVDPFHFEYVG